MSDVSVNIEIKNLAQIKRAFNSSPRIVGPHLVRALNASILKVGKESVRESPVDTGRLRASILGGSYRGGRYERNYGVGLSSSTRLTAEVGPKVDYAIFVHEGTRFQSANRFMVRGIENSRQYVDSIFASELQLALDKIARMF